MGVELLVGGLFSLASAGIQAASARSVQSANAAAQADINENTMKFNRKEAAKARKFSAEQAAIDRSYNSAEAVKSREFNAEQAQAAMDFSSVQSEIARNFEERMSSSAHQREVADLKAAGLNPILSATGGNGAAVPSVPIGSSAVASSSPASHNGVQSAAAMVSGLSAYQRKNIIGEFVSTAMEGLRLDNDLRRAKAADLNAQAAKQNADAAMKNADTNAKGQAAQESKIKAEIERINNDISIALEDLNIRKEIKNASVEEKHAMIEKLMSDIDVNREQAAKIGIEKEELERRIRYGTFLSSYLPLEAREIVGNHMIDFVRENKGAIDYFMKNMNGNYELDNKDAAHELTKNVLNWCVEKGWLSNKLGK